MRSDIMDSDFATAVLLRFREERKPSRKKFKKVVREVYAEFKEAELEACNRTLQRWMKRLGYVYKAFKASVYHDGHERCDVVKHREKYVKRMVEKILPFTTAYSGDNMDEEHVNRDSDGKRYILVYSDECTFTADTPTHGWMTDTHGQQAKSKTRPNAFMASYYFCAEKGFLAHPDFEGEFVFNTVFLYRHCC
jgi:hypothetical protein